MATTTTAAFVQFEARLLLTPLQRQSVSDRFDLAVKYLRSAFPSDSELVLSSTLQMGSAGRGTMIRPLDDIDCLAVFQYKAGIFERYQTDSQAFLYRIRTGLNRYSRVELVGARGQAVRFFYTSTPYVDIAPVVKWAGSDTGYGLPNGTGGWLTTDPYKHNAYIMGKDQQLSGRLLPLIRILKRWNAEHSQRFKSYHLELVAAATFKSLGGNTSDACAKFFDWGQRHISVHDPAGHGGDVSAYLSTSARSVLVQAMQSAHQGAASALAAEQRGDQAEAIRLWRIIFGAEFPAYG